MGGKICAKCYSGQDDNVPSSFGHIESTRMEMWLDRGLSNRMLQQGLWVDSDGDISNNNQN
jgi:hypothetical protein